MQASIDSCDFSNSNGHSLNWYVFRDQKVRDRLKAFWSNGSGINNKRTMVGANIEQKISKRVNVLFRNMENFGPIRSESKNYQYDKMNDLYHAHVWKARFTYVVMWEVDKERRLINIVSMGTHENFDYKRKHSKEEMMLKIEKRRLQDPKYLQYLQFDNKRRKGLDVTY